MLLVVVCYHCTGVSPFVLVVVLHSTMQVVPMHAVLLVCHNGAVVAVATSLDSMLLMPPPLSIAAVCSHLVLVHP